MKLVKLLIRRPFGCHRKNEWDIPELETFWAEKGELFEVLGETEMLGKLMYKLHYPKFKLEVLGWNNSEDFEELLFIKTNSIYKGFWERFK